MPLKIKIEPDALTSVSVGGLRGIVVAERPVAGVVAMVSSVVGSVDVQPD